MLRIVHIMGGHYTLAPEGEWPDLTSARVVSAESVELTEEQVGEFWDAHVSAPVIAWSVLSRSLKSHYTAWLNAALAKYGHGTPTPSREDVYKAIQRSWLDWTAHDLPATFEAHTDAVMALFTEGGKA